MNPFLPFEVREIRPDETAALFVVHAAIAPVDAGQLLDWTQELEGRLEAGSRVWVVARGRRLAGYAAADLLPGLPGVYYLTGGIVPARRRQGLGTMLLRHVQEVAADAGIRQLSCRVADLEGDTAGFLLRRGFYVEHEECLLALDDFSGLPPLMDELSLGLAVFPQAEAVAHFLRVYDDSFTGMAWSQPYTEAEVFALLAQPDDLLFAVIEDRPVGVIWHEMMSAEVGRVEPLGVGREHQGRGIGRRLLLAALEGLRQRGAQEVQIGVWRTNHAAMALYTSLGFVEVDNWYFLAHDVGVSESG